MGAATSMHPSRGRRHVEHRFVNHRTSGAPLETKKLLVRGGPRYTLTLWSTPIPHIARFILRIWHRRGQLRVWLRPCGGFARNLRVRGCPVLALAKRLGPSVMGRDRRAHTTSHHGRASQLREARPKREARSRVPLRTSQTWPTTLLTPFTQLEFPGERGPPPATVSRVDITSQASSRTDLHGPIRGAGRSRGHLLDRG